MKKIFLLFIIFILPNIIIAQITGSGTTITDPYTGSMSSGTFNIPTGTSYFNQITVSGGTLNVAAGAILIATQTSSYITISGTGVLNADGDSGANMITFTSNVSSWARISVSSTSTSLLDYCNITKGLRTGSGEDGYGGGLLIKSSSLTVSNCEFWENTAQYGGGIFVNTNVNPTINNCYIHTNTATKAGGGLYIYSGSGAKVYSCLIEGNQCTNTGTRGGGGISTYVTSGQTRIVNCTIVNNIHNTPNTNYGNNIEIHDSNTGLQYINCVIWGGNNPCVYRSGAAQFSANHFVNSAIQSVYSISGETNISTYNKSFKLNSINTGTNPEGPNFTNPSSANYSLKFKSPLRDAGTQPSPSIALDYLGKPRIGSYDIGAFEIQYSRWKTSPSNNTSWNDPGNWEQSLNPGSAASTGDVIIIAGSSSYPDVSSVTMVTSSYLVLNPKAMATIGTLSNNSTGTLWLKSDSYLVADSLSSLKVTTYNKNSGSEIIELYLQGNSSMWHYISPPINALSASTFSGVGAAVTEYRENLIENDLNNGWVTSTGYHYDVSIPDWISLGWTWPNLNKGYGYNYYSGTSRKFNISGAINTADVTVNLAYNSGNFSTDDPEEQGYNLIGNPFTCSLDWDQVVEDAANSSIWGDVEPTIYFRRGGLTYLYNYSTGFTLPNDYNVNGYLIPPMQGFFIKTNNAVSLTIPANAKVHSASKRYKGDRSVPNIRLQIENSGNTDQAIIWFSDKATSSFDKLLDSRKIFTSENSPLIYSSLGGIKYAINGIPFPESSVTVPLTINSSIAGSYTIKATDIYGLENYKIFLNDNTQNLTVNLSDNNSYSYDAIKGLSTERFTITFSNVLTAIPETTGSNKPFSIYSSGNQVNIQTLSEEWIDRKGEVKIIDLAGRTIFNDENVEFSRDEITQVPAGSTRGIYLVEITSGLRKYVGKVVIR